MQLYIKQLRTYKQAKLLVAIQKSTTTKKCAHQTTYQLLLHDSAQALDDSIHTSYSISR